MRLYCLPEEIIADPNMTYLYRLSSQILIINDDLTRPKTITELGYTEDYPKFKKHPGKCDDYYDPEYTTTISPSYEGGSPAVFTGPLFDNELLKIDFESDTMTLK